MLDVAAIGGSAAPWPRSEPGPGMSTGQVSTILLLLLALVLAGILLALHLRRLREQREHLAALREREQRTRLSLWASSELYWQ